MTPSFLYDSLKIITYKGDDDRIDYKLANLRSNMSIIWKLIKNLIHARPNSLHIFEVFRSFIEYIICPHYWFSSYVIIIIFIGKSNS